MQRTYCTWAVAVMMALMLSAAFVSADADKDIEAPHDQRRQYQGNNADEQGTADHSGADMCKCGATTGYVLLSRSLVDLFF